MSFGNMNTFINILEVENEKDSAGFAAPKNKILASARAYRADRHGTKMWANRAAFSTATALFRFRVIPGLTISPSLYYSLFGRAF